MTCWQALRAVTSGIARKNIVDGLRTQAHASNYLNSCLSSASTQKSSPCVHAVPTPVDQSINLSHIIDPPPSTSPLTTTSKGAEAARHVTGPPCPCNTCRGCGGSGRAAHCRSAEELLGTPLPSTRTRTVQSAEAVTRKTPRASCQEPTTVMHVTMSWCTGTS